MNVALIEALANDCDDVVSRVTAESKRLASRKTELESQRKAQSERIKNHLELPVSKDPQAGHMHDDLSQICVLIDEIEKIDESCLSIEERQDQIFDKVDVLIGNLDLFTRTYFKKLPENISSKLNNVTDLLHKSGQDFKNSIKVVDAFCSVYESNDFEEKYQALEEILDILRVDSHQFRNERALLNRLLKLSNFFIREISETFDPSHILSKIRHDSSELFEIVQGLKKKASVPFELDGEVTYLSPDSAEGKALQRIENSVPDDDLITVVEEGQEVDAYEALERLKKRGYKVKV